MAVPIRISFVLEKGNLASDFTGLMGELERSAQASADRIGAKLNAMSSQVADRMNQFLRLGGNASFAGLERAASTAAQVHAQRFGASLAGTAVGSAPSAPTAAAELLAQRFGSVDAPYRVYGKGFLPAGPAEQAEVQKSIANILGPGVSREDVLKAAGLPPGSAAAMVPNEDGSLVVSGYHPGGADLRRSFYRDESGAPTMNADAMTLAESLRGQGLGSLIVGNMAENAQRLGIQNITTTAIGAPGSDTSGYYASARQGYQGQLPYGVNPPPELGSPTTIQGLMSTEAGRNWWKENGRDFQGTFSTAPGSQSMTTLDSYLRQKVGVGVGQESPTHGAAAEAEPAQRMTVLGKAAQLATDAIGRMSAMINRFARAGGKSSSGDTVTSTVASMAGPIDPEPEIPRSPAAGGTGGGASRGGRSLSSVIASWTVALYGVRAAAEEVYSIFERPFTSIVRATEDARKFELAISGVIGGMDRAREVNNALLRESANIPLSLAETRRLTETMSRQSVFTSSLAMASPDEAARQVAQQARVVGGLSALNPQTSPEEILQVLQQALGGQASARQLRTKLAIDPNDLARLEGIQAKSFTGNPQLLMDALAKYLDRYGPGLDQGRGQLASVSFQKLQDDLTIALEKIGDSGLYDQIVARFRTISTSILDYLNKPAYAERAQQLSQQLGAIFDGLGESMLRLIQNLAGAKDLASTPDAVAAQLASIAKGVADFSKDLPGISSAVGRELNTIVGDLSGIGSVIHTIVHPIDAAKYATLQDGAAAAQVRDEVIVRQLGAMGIRGASVGQRVVDDNSRDPNDPGDAWRHMGSPTDGGGDWGKRTMPEVDTAGIRSMAQRMLAEQIGQALSQTDPSALQNLDEVKWRLRQSIPGFDDRLQGALAANTGKGIGYQLPPDLAQQVNAIGKDQIEPNYATKFHSLEMLADGITTWTADADKLTASFALASLKLREMAGQNGNPDLFAKVTQWRDTTAGQLGGAITGLQAEQQRDPAHAKEIGDRVAALQAALDKVTSGYEGEMSVLAQSIVAKTGSFGVVLATEVSKSGATYAAQVLQMFAQGQTQVQSQARDLLARGGFTNMPVDFRAIPMQEQSHYTEVETAQRLQSIKQLGAGGVSADAFAPGNDFKTTDALVKMQTADNLGPLPQNPSLINNQLFGRTSISEQETAAYQAALQQARSTQAQSFQALQTDPGNQQAQQAWAQATSDVVQFTAKIRELKMAQNEALQGLISFANSAQGALENGLGNVFDSLIEKTHNVRQAIQAMAKSIVNDFSQSASKTIFNTALGAIAPSGGVGAGLGGLVATLFGGLGAHAAEGDVWPGFTPFESGSVVSRPTLGLVGERTDGIPEAIVPMLGPGRSIPLGVDGGGVHAVLPGGRRVPASMPGMVGFADGGIVGSGLGYDRSASPAATSTGASTMQGTGASGDGATINTNIHLDGQVIATHTYKLSKKQLMNDVHQSARPGGPLRRHLSKPN
jgi:hypothetical protein